MWSEEIKRGLLECTPVDAAHRRVQLLRGARHGQLGHRRRDRRAHRASSRSARTSGCSPRTAATSSPAATCPGCSRSAGGSPSATTRTRRRPTPRSRSIDGDAVLGPGRLGEGPRRRHDPAARPRLAVHQHRRREGLPRGGRRGAQDAPDRGATRACSAYRRRAVGRGRDGGRRAARRARRPTRPCSSPTSRTHLAHYKAPRRVRVVASIGRTPPGRWTTRRTATS